MMVHPRGAMIARRRTCASDPAIRARRGRARRPGRIRRPARIARVPRGRAPPSCVYMYAGTKRVLSDAAERYCWSETELQLV